MSSTTNKSATRIITLFILIAFCGLLWVIAPMFLPMFRWTEVDFEKIARAAQAKGDPKMTTTLVSKKYKIEFAYLPRSTSDPRPYVLLKMDPPWHEAYGDPEVDETGRLVRCTVIGDRAGGPVSEFMLGTGQWKDRFFRAEAWRLPPGSLGKDAERPIILFDTQTLEHVSIGEAEVRNSDVKNPSLWEPDDDGFEVP